MSPGKSVLRNRKQKSKKERLLPTSCPRSLTGRHCGIVEQGCWWCSSFLRNYQDVLLFPTGHGKSVSLRGQVDTEISLSLPYSPRHAIQFECQVSGRKLSAGQSAARRFSLAGLQGG